MRQEGKIKTENVKKYQIFEKLRKTKNKLRKHEKKKQQHKTMNHLILAYFTRVKK